MDITYKAELYDNDQLIDTTFIDENDEELVWDLFKEFGHKWSDQAYIIIDKCTCEHCVSELPEKIKS